MLGDAPGPRCQRMLRDVLQGQTGLRAGRQVRNNLQLLLSQQKQSDF